jgi:Saxitoxin biosynthesis operon protein SxtJ
MDAVTRRHHFFSSWPKEFAETLAEREASDRSFGLIVAGALAVLGAWPLWRGRPVKLPLLAIALAFGLTALIAPSVLRIPKRAWLFFGFVLGKFVNPIVLGVIFFLLFAPVAIVRRLLKKDPLRLRWQPELSSYWIRREAPPSAMTEQF